ncbi:MAG: DUF1476 domain-containing protein [Hyphomicrobiales bacterium]|nr:MAG: DUF1476 domain-containing protein [Hyphomicrobiales bacterium]
MNTTFDKREDGFEAKYAHDQKIMFKATARRNKLAGLWAAELMGITGEAAESYAKEVIMADFKEPGDNDVIEKIKGDLDEAGVEKSEHQIKRTLSEMMATAIKQIEAESE